jgi:hypothetical protein
VIIRIDADTASSNRRRIEYSFLVATKIPKVVPDGKGGNVMGVRVLKLIEDSNC